MDVIEAGGSRRVILRIAPFVVLEVGTTEPWELVLDEIESGGTLVALRSLTP